MDLLNTTKMQAGYSMGLKPDGRELLVVVVKGTFSLPPRGEEPMLLDKQVDLVEADVFTGDPGFSAPLYETDYAPYKPRCDVLFNGSAYAPGGRESRRIEVSLRVDLLSKSFAVVGNREWRRRFGSIRPSSPKPFSIMPISYNNAFGGIDNRNPNPETHSAYYPNSAGCGYHSDLDAEYIEGQPLPNTEERDQPIMDPRGPYRPMAFGSLGRSWQQRLAFAGTYDENWLDKVFPFLPADFDERYYQAAPQDQQIDYLRGGEEVVLTNLSPHGQISFQIPEIEVPIVFFLKNHESKETMGVLDTIILEPDLERILLCWRASLPLRRNMFEVEQVLVGKMPRGWYRARKTGKTYYSGLGEMVRARQVEE